MKLFKIQISTLNFILIFLLTFIVSLHTFFDNRMFGLFSITILLFLIINYENLQFSKKQVLGISLLFILFTMYYFKAKLSSYYIDDNILFYYLRVTIGLLFSTVLYVYSKENDQKVVNILKFVISFHLFFYFLQAFFLYTGKEINLIQWYATEAVQRNNNGMFAGELFRPSGLFNEPGTYSVVMSLLLYSYYLISKQATSFILYVGVLSVFTSFSSQGIALMTIFSLVVLKKYIKLSVKNIVFLAILLLLLSIIFIYISDYLLLRFTDDREDISLLTRLYALSLYIDLPIEMKLFGTGLGANIFDALIADTGLWFTSVLFFGIFGIALIVYMLFFSLKFKKIDILLLLIIVLFTKAELRHLPLWLFISSIFIYYNHINKRS